LRQFFLQIPYLIFGLIDHFSLELATLILAEENGVRLRHFGIRKSSSFALPSNSLPLASTSDENLYRPIFIPFKRSFGHLYIFGLI
jgi:hypothetical protein